MQPVISKACALLLSITLLLSGCTSTVVRDDVKQTARLDGDCAGGKWTGDASLAILPVPVVASSFRPITAHSNFLASGLVFGRKVTL
jgi:uncharacterized protein YceK